ncbi:MAG: glutamine-hydrolyzing GMP synthase [Bacteroidetes bacterium]|nr:glutamine-hydrolyzing GMP synthase [Bacteroidota bacterium]MBT3423842.1 glutamine-hydrolyzing GMP synthase [Bacteroidota bacterium]MBT3934674.1 glutamine-hydrolyzing GMP synthase [Bacteroidota bacterium]MBT4337154.1 glutamine-hydrolyzing GMP synthase [Bacteroidota bacterium]MBT4728346.1 glutamine-hydrolyzing GMP synthase [Bacteroidota bacterium]
MEKIIIIDFGSQFTQLIARKIRELNVYSEIHPYDSVPELDHEVKGVVLSGSPFSTLEEQAPTTDLKKILGHKPVLGLCYGAQLLVLHDQGKVERSHIREYGRASLVKTQNQSILFNDVNNNQIWMSHSDTILELPAGYEIIAETDDIPVAAFQNKSKHIYGFQYHPEVYHTTDGKAMLQNFLKDVCGCTQDWTPAHYVDTTIAALKEKLGNDKVVMGLSGGVDSTVAATLLHQAIHKNLYCIFVDNGLLRKNEFAEVIETYKQLDLNVIAVDAKEEFYKALTGISEPEGKRKAIGKTFIDVFEREAKKIENVGWLGQGTIYPDVIESAGTSGPAATIKSHHNVGGLPEKMSLKIIEPLRLLFKDEVRRVAAELHIPENLYNRHPFPGPGLGIRILGEISLEKVQILQDADRIYMDEMKKDNLYDKIWQAATILLPVKSVGVMGDERTYEYTVALRAVTSTDGMTADWYPMPHEFLSKVSNKIINSVKGINRVVYDISSKPPATIEWE